jgi:putative NADH-flavin reductase
MMKLVIFGASGRTGQHLVRKALAAGYEVTALVRTPQKLEIVDPALRIVQGDATDPEAVNQAVAGNQVVLSALGPTRTSGDDMLNKAMKNILAAMKQHGLRRVIVLTGAGVGSPKDKPQISNKLMSGLLNLLVHQGRIAARDMVG